MMKRILSLALLAAFSLSITACNTIAGVGKDVQKVGDKVEDCTDGRC